MEFYDRDGNSFVEFSKTLPQERRVARTVVPTPAGDIVVSTVWLSGIDHGWSLHNDHRPIIFETMVFNGEFDQELARYSTEEQAMRGHLEVLDRLRAGKPPWEHPETRVDWIDAEIVEATKELE